MRRQEGERESNEKTRGRERERVMRRQEGERERE